MGMYKYLHNKLHLSKNMRKREENKERKFNGKCVFYVPFTDNVIFSLLFFLSSQRVSNKNVTVYGMRRG